MRKPRVDWFVIITALVFTVSCGGGGCGGCGSFEPIPGGFPAAKRTQNATQLRVSQTGLAAVSANPAGLLGSIAGGMNGVLKFNAPANCGGSTPICCPGGTAINPCGPIDIDLNKQAGDSPRLELKPAQGASRLDVTVRARVKTEMDIPVKVPLIGDCGVKIDTTAGSVKDIQIDAPISFVQDGAAGTTKVAVGTVALSNLASEDVALTGGFGCAIANLGLSFFIDTLAGQLTSAVQGAIQDQTCKKCPSGQVAECGSSFATACTNGVCQEGNACFQELGLDGRARGSSLFASLSPGTTGALDLYAVAGGYATSNTNGLALGLLGGMQPGGTVRDRCGPPGSAPAGVTIPQSAFFQGNTRPDTNAPFDVAIGLHKSQLAELAYAGYDGGILCLTIGSSFAAQLSTDTLSLLSRSLGKLVETNSQMAVGIRPQSQPVIGLGKNTFVDDGQGGKKLMDPLLDIKFTAAELDFFVSIDDQWIRAFTVVSDIHLPIGLQVAGMGKLTPVLGDVPDAFTNVTVKNTKALTESPAELAGLFPSLLGVVLPQLSNGLSPISLPSLGGLNLNVTDITAVDNNSFLAIFANLTPAMTIAKPVETRVALGTIDNAPVEIARDPARWAGARQPSVTLEMGGDRDGLEWSYRIDDGTWSAWSASPRQTLTSRVFWLAGTHKIEVRAREVGKPETIDETPVVVEVPIGPAVSAKPQVAPFHGQGNGQGCSCDSSGSPVGLLPLLLVALVLLVPMRRLKKLGATVWLAAIACLPGCSCGGGGKCGDQPCMAGEVAHGSLGRFTSITSDDSRVLVATYDQLLGDLVVADVTDASKQQLTVVDGIPDGVSPTYDGGYRGGVEDAGPNVGAWTSIALADGKARIAYQDRDAGVLKYAHETGTNKWASYVVDPGMGGEETGRYSSMVIDADGHPTIAYLALGSDDGTGHRNAELRIARANTRDPNEGEWTTTTVATAPSSCAGLCAGGESCIADTDAEICAVPTSDCTPGCGSGSVCVAGACHDEVVPAKFAELAKGTGLLASLVVLPDGRLAVTYYDRPKRALMISVENAPGANAYTETQLDANPNGDRGMWSSAAVDSSGTVHVAYQEALGDEVMYTTWNGTPGTPELVDDGQRAGDRPHNVGASTTMYLVNGTPTIAYQDGMTSDVYIATKSGTTWSNMDATPGDVNVDLLDGFWIGVTTAHGGSPILAWGTIDPSQDPNGQLTVWAP